MANYTGLYLHDVYDIAQTDGPTYAFNHSDNIVNSVDGLTYAACHFSYAVTGETLRYALTPKVSATGITNITAMATNLGNGFEVGFNGAATQYNSYVGPDSAFITFAMTHLADCTEIAIVVGGYADPIAFYLPGATLGSPGPTYYWTAYKGSQETNV